MSNFREVVGHFWKFEKLSNSQNTNISYIILKQVIWRFQIYNLFREIFKFHEDKSSNVFLEIFKCFRKTANFAVAASVHQFSSFSCQPIMITMYGDFPFAPKWFLEGPQNVTEITRW